MNKNKAEATDDKLTGRLKSLDSTMQEATLLVLGGDYDVLESSVRNPYLLEAVASQAIDAALDAADEIMAWADGLRPKDALADRFADLFPDAVMQPADVLLAAAETPAA